MLVLEPRDLRQVGDVHKPVIHLNIKPSSLLQENYTGKIFLTNFIGIESAILPPSYQPFLAISDRDFTAPEQREDKPNFSSDIYALGKTIIYAMTGDENLKNSEYLSLSSNLSTSKKPHDNAVTISSQLTKILNKMTALNSNNRYQSAVEVLAELDRKQNVINLPPPFSIAPTAVPSRTVAEPEKSRSKLGKILLWSWLILPFLGAAIALFLGINHNKYKGFVSYTNEAYSFKLNYPETWRVRELDDPITGGVVVFSSLPENSLDPFIEEVYISVEYLADDINNKYYQSLNFVDHAIGTIYDFLNKKNPTNLL